MLPDERDLGYLWDMREAVRDCIDFVEGASYEQFSADKMMHSAVERRLEILGEAASRVSEAFQTDHPEIPWKEIKGLRVIFGTQVRQPGPSSTLASRNYAFAAASHQP